MRTQNREFLGKLAYDTFNTWPTPQEATAWEKLEPVITSGVPMMTLGGEARGPDDPGVLNCTVNDILPFGTTLVMGPMVTPVLAS